MTASGTPARSLPDRPPSPGTAQPLRRPFSLRTQRQCDAAVVVAPPPGGGDAVAYCMQTYRSYDPRSGTYLGYDGYRHPCP